MFFILSKILLFLILPFTWIFILLVWAASVKRSKLKKRLFYTALGMLVLFSNTFIAKRIMHAWDMPAADTGNKTYTCAILLGGFTSVDDDGTGYFNGTANRFIEVLKLKASGKISKILMTGGSGQLLKGSEFKEADFTVQQLRLLNIPDSVILSENKSRNTIENAVFSKKILDAKKISGPYLLVTSAFHMRRSMYTFKKAGLDVVPYPSDYAANNNGFSISDLVPDATVLSLWNTYAKEMVGYITYHLKSF